MHTGKNATTVITAIKVGRSRRWSCYAGSVTLLPPNAAAAAMWRTTAAAPIKQKTGQLIVRTVCPTRNCAPHNTVAHCSKYCATGMYLNYKYERVCWTWRPCVCMCMCITSMKGSAGPGDPVCLLLLLSVTKWP
jgi:hypothetical protein